MSNVNAAAPAVAPRAADASEQISGLTNASWLWLQGHWWQIAVAIGVGFAIFTALHALRSLSKRLCDRHPDRTGWATVIGRTIQKTNNFFIVMASAKLVAGYAQPPVEVATTITFLFTIAAVFQAAIWARELVLGGIGMRVAEEPGAGIGSAMSLIRLFVTFVLFAIALIVVLDNLGVNITGLVAGLGIGGIAVGLAAKDIFDDLFAALAIIFDRPFRRGDAIAYDDTSGTVEEIGLKSTRIRSTSGEQKIIANKNLLDKEITNNRRRTHRRTKFTLGITYETPTPVLRRIPDILKEIVTAEKQKLIHAEFVNFGESSVDFELEFDTPGADIAKMRSARHIVGLAILERFQQEGIAFAYPTQVAYTAAPDGTIIMPYEGEPAPAPNAAKTPATKPKSSRARSSGS